MNAIPHLSGAPLEPTDGVFTNKAVMVVKNPENAENNRKIESISLERFFADAGRIVVSESKPTEENYKDADNNFYATGTLWVYKYESKGTEAVKVYTLVNVDEREIEVDRIDPETSEVMKDEEGNNLKDIVIEYSANWINNSNIAYDASALTVEDAMTKSLMVVEIVDNEAIINYINTKDLMGNSGITYTSVSNPTKPSGSNYNLGDRWVNIVTGDLFMFSKIKLGGENVEYWKSIDTVDKTTFESVERDAIHGLQNYDSEFTFGRLITDNILTPEVFRKTDDFISLSNGTLLTFLDDSDSTGYTALISKNEGNNWKPILKSNFDFNFKVSTYYESSDGTLYLSVKSDLNEVNSNVLLKSSDGGFSWLAILYAASKSITYINEDEYGNIIVHNTFNAWVVYHDGSYRLIDLSSNSIIKVIIYHRMYFVTPNATFKLNDDYTTTRIPVKSVDAYESVLIDKIVCLFTETGVSYKTINTALIPKDRLAPFSEEGVFSDLNQFGQQSGASFDNYTLIGFDEKSILAVLNNNTTDKIELFDGKIFTELNVGKFITDGQIFTNVSGNAVYKNSAKFIGDFIFINASSEGKIYIFKSSDYSQLGSYVSNVLPIVVNDNIYLYGNDYTELDIIPYNIFSEPELTDTDIFVRSIKGKSFRLENNFITAHENVLPENQLKLKSIYQNLSQKTALMYVHNDEIKPGEITSGFNKSNLLLKYKHTPSDLHVIPYIIEDPDEVDESKKDKLYLSVDMNFYKIQSYHSGSTYRFFIYEKYVIIIEISSNDFMYIYWIDITDMSNKVRSTAEMPMSISYLSMDILNDKLFIAQNRYLYIVDLKVDTPTPERVDLNPMLGFNPTTDANNSEIKVGCESGYLVILADDVTEQKSYLIYAKDIANKGMVYSEKLQLSNYVNVKGTDYDKVPLWKKFLFYTGSDGAIYRKEINSNNLEEYLDSVTDMDNCVLMDFVKNDKYCYFVVSDNRTEETTLVVMKDDFIEYKIKLGTTVTSDVKIFDMNHKIFIDIEYDEFKDDGDYYGTQFSYNHELYLHQETREGGIVKLVDKGCTICPLEYYEDRFAILKEIRVGGLIYTVKTNYNINNFAPFYDKSPEMATINTDGMIGMPTKGRLLPLLDISDGEFVWRSYEYSN